MSNNPSPILAAQNAVPVAPAPTGSTEQQVLQLGHALSVLVSNYNALLAQFKVLQKSIGKQVAISGTPHQVIVTPTGNRITLSTPQDIDIASSVQFGTALILPPADGACFTVQDTALDLIFQVNTFTAIASATRIAIQPLVDEDAFNVKNAAGSITALDVNTSTLMVTAQNVALAVGGGGNFFANSGNGGISGSFGSPVVCTFEQGLLTFGDPTSGGGGGSGVPEVPFDAGTHVMYVRQSVTAPGPGGNWEAMTTYFSGIAPATLWAGATSLVTLGTITTGVWNGTPIAIADGGTGKTTPPLAFNALSPAVVTGDMIYCSNTTGTVNDPLPIGSAGNFLGISGGIPDWKDIDVVGTITTGVWGSGATPIGVTSGGTGLGSGPTTGHLLIGNAGNYDLNTLTAGTGISIDDTSVPGQITITATSSSVPVPLTLTPSADGTVFTVTNHANTVNVFRVSSATSGNAVAIQSLGASDNAILVTNHLADSTFVVDDSGNVQFAGSLYFIYNTGGSHAVAMSFVEAAGPTINTTFNGTITATVASAPTFDVTNGANTVTVANLGGGTLDISATGQTATFRVIPSGNNVFLENSVSSGNFSITAPGGGALTGTIHLNASNTEVTGTFLMDTGIIAPTVNSTTAITIVPHGSGTPMVTFDTTNHRVGINKTPGAFDLDVNGDANVGGTLTMGHLILPTS